MCRAADIQHQPIPPLQPNPRTVPRGPAAQDLQKPLILQKVGRGRLQIGTKGAGIGMRHTLVQPLMCRLRVKAIKPVGIALFEGEGKGAFQRAAP
ncbi:hypothetical protein NBRC116593_23850 [Sulfitobacter pacificus]